ncbi:hypothetical protein M427DRAFT_47828 [Gonapodya prolifera JEL478]|uniref:Condensin complex subunit 2 n=1 Tax=Gonapodya prolifera (strain JEL478) TaxID=1344416 RepID=A0A139A2B0_GONPJ|nr:hypothetical protein M427DRAFT_47828 [Gonapodya prolifera JEL478]|eukprot:KXS10685.1 hypothetical protein M427DRAFT_47828 [Gonapodya prolifera JEL478]
MDEVPYDLPEERSDDSFGVEDGAHPTTANFVATSQNDGALFEYFDSMMLRNWAGPERWKAEKDVKGCLRSRCIFIRDFEQKPNGVEVTDSDANTLETDQTQYFLDADEDDEGFEQTGLDSIGLLQDSILGSNALSVLSGSETHRDSDYASQPVTAPKKTAKLTIKEHLNEKEEKQQFSSIVRDLQTFYPQQKLKDISAPFVFICLLHLANEKTLAIDQSSLTELTVYNPFVF